MDKPEQNSIKTVNAPSPIPESENLPENRVISVQLKSDEDVEWVWSTAPNGVSYVSGYKIVKST